MVGSSGRKIVVEFVGDASALKNGVGDANQALTGFSGKAQAAGRIAGKALAGGLLLAGAAAISATKAAAEDEAAQAQLAQQLKQAANATDTQIASVEDWISKASLATGVADDELRPAFAKLATATGDVGEAQDLLTKAMDIAAGSGQSLESVTKTLAKAQTTGSVAAYAKLGGATKDAAGNTLSLADATEALADKYKGSAAKAAETTAGKTKIMQVQFGELQEQIGAKLLPVMTNLAEVGLKVVNWISNNTTTVGVLIAALGSLLAITTAVGFATKVAGAIQTTYAAITKAVAAAQWLLNAAMTANPIGLLVVAIAALVAGLILAYQHSETFRKIVDAAFGAIKNIVTNVIGFVVDFVKNHWQLLIGIITGPLGIIVIQVIKHWDQIKTAISTAIATVKNVIGAGWDAIVGAVRTVLGVYRSIIVGAFDGIRNFFQNAVAAWKTIFNNAWDAIKSGFQNAKEALSNIAGNMRDAVGNAFDAVKGTIQGVIDKVQWLIDKIGDLISKIKSIPSPHIDIPGLKVGSGGGGGGKGGGGKGGGGASSSLFEHTPADLAARGASGAGAGAGTRFDITVTVAPGGNPVETGRQVVKAVRTLERATGRRLLFSPA